MSGRDARHPIFDLMERMRQNFSDIGFSGMLMLVIVEDEGTWKYAGNQSFRLEFFDQVSIKKPTVTQVTKAFSPSNVKSTTVTRLIGLLNRSSIIAFLYFPAFSLVF